MTYSEGQLDRRNDVSPNICPSCCCLILLQKKSVTVSKMLAYFPHQLHRNRFVSHFYLIINTKKTFNFKLYKLSSIYQDKAQLQFTLIYLHIYIYIYIYAWCLLCNTVTTYHQYLTRRPTYGKTPFQRPI